jgi:glycosyltransferase involved in cell wall biosynthesis
MRIGLIYLGRHGPGGPISLELASQLAQKADLFAVVSQSADHIGYWRDSRLALIEVPTFTTRLGAALSLLDTARLSRLARQIAAFDPDVLLYPMVHPWTPALQKRLKNVPAVITVHDPAAHPGLIHRLSSLWETKSAQSASRCIVLAETFVATMRAKGMAAEKIDVIPHPIFSFYDRFTKTSVAHRPARSILFFGRITRYKGLDVLVEAFRIAQAKRPELRLNIVGEGDLEPYRHSISGIDNVIVTNRWIDDAEVPAIFQAADIVVVPYTSASQSGVIALAASFRRPVIATRVGAIPEQIRDEETGVLVEPGSAAALASAIERLLADDALRMRTAERLGSEMRANCNWDITSDLYLKSCRNAALEFRTLHCALTGRGRSGPM